MLPKDVRYDGDDPSSRQLSILLFMDAQQLTVSHRNVRSHKERNSLSPDGSKVDYRLSKMKHAIHNTQLLT